MYGKFYEQMFDYLKKNKYTLLDPNFLNTTADSFYQKLDEGTRNDYVEFYKRNIKWIKESDVNIFECTLPSLSIGYQIEKSLQYNRPTIILYLKDNIPYFLVGSDEEKLIVKTYNEKNILDVLSSAITDAKYLSDKRFNFFISPSLLNYLNKVSHEMNITKSTFIRNLILEHKKRTPNNVFLRIK